MGFTFNKNIAGRAIIGLLAWLSLLIITCSGVAQAGPGLPSGIIVERNQALPDFPQRITFQFKARIAPGGPVIKWLELAYRLEGEVATSVRRQNFDKSGQLEVEFGVDNQKDYFPPGVRVNYYWLLGSADGQIYETPRQQFSYNDLRFKFKELQNGLLTVRWYQGDDNFGRNSLNKAQATIERLSQLYKVKPDRPISLTIYPDSRTMFTALPPNTQEWVGGQAIPELGTVVLAIGPGDAVELGRSIPHEVSHQVVYQATRNPYNTPPKWLDEGLAVNNQDRVDGFLQEAFERGRAGRNLYALRVLNGSFPADSQQSFLAYGQSLQVVRYILKKYGDGAIEKMMAAFKDGVSYDEAVQAGMGISLEQLDWDFKQSIGYPQPALAAPTTTAAAGPAPTPTLTFLPTPTIRSGLAPSGNGTGKGGQQSLARWSEQFAPQPPDPKAAADFGWLPGSAGAVGLLIAGGSALQIRRHKESLVVRHRK